MIGLLLGLLAWTIAEYAVHRFMLHGCCDLGHMAGHHRDPSDYSIGPSWIVIAAFFFVLWAALLSIGNGMQAAGFTAGFVFYAFVHHACHHPAPSWRWLDRLRQLHRAHHTLGDVNYGVSSPLWDAICGTYRVWR